ncbi:MAG: hypothetical protein HZA88_03585 [Verrucomicrobia bacterium]|nr:hypothetical protein [Verrucomicrobiota bacterium]
MTNKHKIVMNIHALYVLSENSQELAGFSRVHEQEPQSRHGVHHRHKDAFARDRRTLQLARQERIQFKAKLRSEPFDAQPEEFRNLSPV